MKFQIFFFKENTRQLDMKALVDFLCEDESIKIQDGADDFSLIYNNKLVGLNYSFIFSKISRVPDIARLSPKFLDLDCYVEFDMLLPLFKVEMISSLIEKVCSRFNFFIYNYLFEDVTVFSKDIIKQAYDKARRLYKQKFLAEYQSLHYISKSKLDTYFKYLVDAKMTNQYYNDKYIFLNAQFAMSQEQSEPLLLSEFSLDAPIVIAPNVDLVEIFMHDNRFIYKYSDIEQLIKKYLKDFPGFVPNTKMIEESNLKKVRKIITKMKVKPIMERVMIIDQERLIDF